MHIVRRRLVAEPASPSDKDWSLAFKRFLKFYRNKIEYVNGEYVFDCSAVPQFKGIKSIVVSRNNFHYCMFDSWWPFHKVLPTETEEKFLARVKTITTKNPWYQFICDRGDIVGLIYKEDK